MKTKKILGLDIGTTSIGWAIVEATNQKHIDPKTGKEIDTVTDINNDRIGIHQKDGKAAVGVRIIKQDTDSIQQFNAGQKLNIGSKKTPTANRREKRGSRRLKSRYKLRRQKLYQILDFLGMLPEGISKIISNDGTTTYAQDKNSKYYTAQKGNRNSDDIGKAIYELRDRAIRQEITLEEWGRIMLHLNQWRGYSSDRFTVEEKQTFDYYTAEITALDLDNKESIYDKDDKEKKEIKYFKIKIGIKFFEKINISDDNENPNYLDEFEGYIFRKEFNYKLGDIVTFKKPEWKQDKIGKKILAEYYKIENTNPKPEDWGYKYQTLQKNLTTFCNAGGTVGSYFYQNFYQQKNIERIRTNIVNRDWYEKEFDEIFELQYEKHKEHFEKLTIEDIVASAFHRTYKDGAENKTYIQILIEVKKKGANLKEQILYLISKVVIYYQRPWQQAKNKGECTFEFVPDMMSNTEYIEGVTEPNKKYINNTKNPSKKIIKDGKELGLKGRTVIPRSHPLHQEFKIWNQINNVKLFYHQLDEKAINLFEDSKKFIEKTGKTIEEAKDLLYKKLNSGESKTASWYSFVSNKKEGLGLENICDEIEILQAEMKVKKTQGVNTETGEVNTEYFTVNYRKWKKDVTYSNTDLKGNSTLYQINKILELEDKGWYNKIHPVSKDQEITNLQLLWEIIYDINISDANKVSKLIQNKFPSIDKDKADQLSKIKFDDSGMGQLSAKAIRNLLPLMNGGNNLTAKSKEKIDSLIKVNEEEKELKNENKLVGLKDFFRDAKTRLVLADKTTATDFTYLSFTEASAIIYGSHSSKGIQGNFKAIETVRQHSMNNPVVEKIVNETIRVVNDIYKEYGFDEVRIELSRELKASAQEREAMDDGMKNNAKRNELAKRMIRELFNNTDASSKNITLLKIYEDEAKQLTIEDYEELKKNGVNYENSENKEFKSFKTVYTEYNLKEPSKADITRYKLWLEQKCQCPYTGEVIRLSEIFTAKYEKEHILPKALYPLDEYSNYVITRTCINKWKANRIAQNFIEQEQFKTIIDNTDNKTLTILGLPTYENHVKKLFSKGKKLNNLLRKDLPEDPINRELKDTQYINKKLKEKLAEIVGSERVHTTTGKVTDTLRESWHLNDVMKELMRSRYENFKFTFKQGEKPALDKINFREDFTDLKTNETKQREVFPGYSKRYDHRHHIIDAIIVASTKQWHIQYLNTMNAENVDLKKGSWLKDEICRKSKDGNYQLNKFTYPWQNFTKTEIQHILEQTIVARKGSNLLLSPSKHPSKVNGKEIIVKTKENKLAKPVAVRGSLHDEMLVGVRYIYDNSKKYGIEDIVELIFKKRDVARQNLKPVRNYNDLITSLVFKEKYKKTLNYLFEKCKPNNLNNEAEYKANLLLEISKNKSKYFDWAYLNIEQPANRNTDSKGTIDKLNADDILDAKTSRHLNYRKELITEIELKIKTLKKTGDTEQVKYYEDKLILATNFNTLYHNAIYDVKTPSLPKLWTPLFELNKNDISKIEYSVDFITKQPNRTEQIKEAVTDYLNKFENTKENVLLENPLFIKNKHGKEVQKIPIKKARVKNSKKLDTLYPIRPNSFVALGNNYMVYVFEDNNRIKSWKLLRFIEALELKLNSKERIKNEELFPIELKPEKAVKQIFTLTQSDIIFITPTRQEIIIEKKKEKTINKPIYNQEELYWLFDLEISSLNTLQKIEEKRKIIVENLWIVKQFSESTTGTSIEFAKLNMAKSITIPIMDTKIQSILDGKIVDVLSNEKAKNKIMTLQNEQLTAKEDKKKNIFLEEQDMQKNIELFENCVKVFTNRLGTKIVPYWMFNNGIWHKSKAKELGLIL